MPPWRSWRSSSAGGGRALSRFVADALQGRLVAAPSRSRRAASGLLFAAAAALLVVALMRPQWGGEFVETSAVGAEIMIALDVSRSMLSEDAAPNRLERAKAEIRDLLGYLDGNQVGLIVFAGRASVVSPLTPDFGFLRLVLDEVSPASVRRGGTRLEEPIRKAVEGFGAEGDVSRILLLITDGEDQDSFPLDAAAVAAERGVRILAVGLGDEAGSEILLTDPETGARTLLRDADGRVVRSRLDGDLLRDLALATEGAYVPAGTGVLDLESIYDAHIAPLMRRGSERHGRTVRKDAFQWAVLLGLVALVASVAVRAAGPASVALAVALWLAPPPAGAANPPEPAPLLPPGVVAPGDEPIALPPAVDRDDTDPTDPTDDTSNASPRERFNAGLRSLGSGDLDAAERDFEAARDASGVDGEVRFRATYNLGWVEVRRADPLLASDPEAALAALERAADRFRAATVLRPNHPDARRNLEIVLDRAAALADALAPAEAAELEARLDALIERQRALIAPIRDLVAREQVERGSGRADLGEPLRAAFRAAEVEARALLADAGDVVELAGRELDALGAKPAEERTPEDELRAAQLDGVLRHLHRGREKLGQARQQLRQRQSERAHRRAAAALDADKRAREQLRGPVQVLDDLLADALAVGAATTALVHAGNPALGDAPPPAWLDAEYLAQSQADWVDRTEELDARLQGGLQAAAVQPDGLSPALRAVLEAEPFVREAAERGAEARDLLATGGIEPAVAPQRAAALALAEARERFLDLAGLIETAAADERRIEAVVTAPEATPASLAEYAEALAELQGRNVERAVRMGTLLEREREVLSAPPPPNADPAAAQQRLAILDQAEEGIGAVEALMRGAAAGLEAVGANGSPGDLDATRTSVAEAVTQLDALRRLFMTLVERIRETARRQQELGDRTEAAAMRAGPDGALSEALGPVRGRQEALAGVAEALAGSLHDQSFEPGAQGADGTDPEAARQLAERFALAAERVLVAREAMGSAAGAMAEDPATLDAIRPPQDTAVAELAAALEILSPPQEPESDDEGDSGDGEQPESGEPDSGAGDTAPDPQPSDPGDAEDVDPGRLLQEVRDREARRHREQSRGGRLQSEPVERDW